MATPKELFEKMLLDPHSYPEREEYDDPFVWEIGNEHILQLAAAFGVPVPERKRRFPPSEVHTSTDRITIGGNTYDSPNGVVDKIAGTFVGDLWEGQIKEGRVRLQVWQSRSPMVVVFRVEQGGDLISAVDLGIPAFRAAYRQLTGDDPGDVSVEMMELALVGLLPKKGLLPPARP